MVVVRLVPNAEARPRIVTCYKSVPTSQKPNGVPRLSHSFASPTPSRSSPSASRAATKEVAGLTAELNAKDEEIERLERESSACDLVEEQKGTITALNMALGGEDSTSTENLIDEVDYNEKV